MPFVELRRDSPRESGSIRLVELMRGLDAIHVVRSHEAFAGRLCVSAWLGHGDALFLGFGEEVLPERDSEGRRLPPPFQLTTNFADWSVEGAGAGTSAESAKLLVGQQAVGWELLEGNALRIVFARGRTLLISPCGEEEGVSDAWSVRSPDGRLVAVATDGRAALADASRSVADWSG